MLGVRSPQLLLRSSRDDLHCCYLLLPPRSRVCIHPKLETTSGVPSALRVWYGSQRLDRSNLRCRKLSRCYPWCARHVMATLDCLRNLSGNVCQSCCGSHWKDCLAPTTWIGTHSRCTVDYIHLLLPRIS